MKKLKCIHHFAGFTVGKEYDVLDEGMNVVAVRNDTGNMVMFGRVEGYTDFKNYFTAVAWCWHLDKKGV